MVRHISLFVAAFLTVPALATAAAQEAPPPATIRVVGEASVSAKPDVGELDLGVISEAPTAAAAGADNARKMDRIVAALKKEVGAGGEVRTIGYNVSQRYGEQKPRDIRPPIVGYTVSNVVRARFGDVTAAGKLIDLALKLGANEVQRVGFSIKNAEPVQAEALKAAAVKARARATALASALGVRLGNVVSVSDGEVAPPRPLSYGMASLRSMEKQTPVEAGNVEVEATVTIYFAIVR